MKLLAILIFIVVAFAGIAFCQSTDTGRSTIVDTVNNSYIGSSRNGKWVGEYHDFDRSHGWLEIELKGPDSLITGTIIVAEQEIHGQSKSTGIVSGKYELGILKLTAQFQRDVKMVLTAVDLGFGDARCFMGSYDSTPSKKTAWDWPSVTSGIWEVNRESKEHRSNVYKKK